MNRNTVILLLCLLFSTFKLIAQSDPYSGTWQMDYIADPDMPPIHIEMQVAAPEKNILYPAQLLIRSESFSGTYQLLLVKKIPGNWPSVKINTGWPKHLLVL